jgi:hypothetical protein
MRTTARSLAALLGFVMLIGVAHAQAPLLTEVKTIASQSAPVEQSFEIPRDGEYELTLTDFAFPAALDAVRLAVTRGDTLVTSLNAAEAGHRFTTTAGTHFVRVVGIPKSSFRSGSFGVEIKAVSGGAQVLQLANTLSLSAETAQGRGVIAASFNAPAAGLYEVTLSDLQLPQSLQTLTLAITRPGSTELVTMNAAGVQTFQLQAGDYQIFVIGQAQSGNAGLLAATVRALASGANVFTQTLPIGEVSLVGSTTLSAGSHTLTLSDFAFPVALAQSGAVIAHFGTVAARLTTPGNTLFTASTGEYAVFAYAAPAASSASGSYGLELRPQGGAAVFSAAKAVGGAAGPVPSYVFPIDVATAGSYRVRLTDFEFPAPFAPLSLAASQSGALTGTLSAPGSLDLNLTAGRVVLLVIAKPSATGGALFGVDLTAASGGDALFETTQGVGSLFSVRKVFIATAGQYNVSLMDLAFPKRFLDLSAVVTRGADRAGSIFGGGTFSFAATSGNYFVNFIAQGDLLDATKSSDQRAGTYAMSVAAAPPAPTITLTANPSQVRSGEKVTLTWSTQNATSCTASSGWSGSKSAQGSEQSAAITASTSFALTCTGPGGNSNQSVSVGITASAKSGGGGAMEWVTILALLGVLYSRRERSAATAA